MNAWKTRSPAPGFSAGALVTLLSLFTVLTGCASPSPAPVLLTLPPTAVAAMPPSTGASAPLLAVRRVSIPEYMVARRVRFRADAATLAEWPNTYWAERIEIGVTREFVAALRSQLPGWSLCDASCSDQSPSMNVQVELVTMDYLRSARKLQARARITLTDASTPPHTLRVEEWPYELSAEGDTAQAQAQAIADLLARVATATAAVVSGGRP